MTPPQMEVSEHGIDQLIHSLDSLMDGGLAAEKLTLCGQRAVPHLAKFLLDGAPRTISLPRCRAVHILGDLGAREVLMTYLKQYKHPMDPEVLFAEDAVRSAAAQELAIDPPAEAFRALLEAAWQRATGGLVLALGKFQRPESVPLLFHILEDDVCRQEAMDSLRKMPEAVHQFGILTVRGATGITLDGSSDVCRRRAILQLLSEVDMSRDEWPDLRKFLFVGDPAAVLATAKIGLSAAPTGEWAEIIMALFRVAARFSFVEEGEAEELLDAHSEIAHRVALQLRAEKQESRETPKWSSPFWRILNHVLGGIFESKQRHTS